MQTGRRLKSKREVFFIGQIIIIGAGAAGLAAAYSAAQTLGGAAAKHKIILLEKNARPARKMMITGKGRCNLTNNCDTETLIRNTVHNGKFLYSAFSALSPQEVMELFENWGVPLKTERGNRVFPVSDKAADIVDALVGAVKRNGARIIQAAAADIITENGAVSGVLTESGEKFPADAVILATGGASYPLTGSSGDGYRIAAALGHRIEPPRPSLIPLECHEGFCSRLAGLSLKNVTLSVYENGKKRPVFRELGELLFTHTGISGPLALSASACIGECASGKYRAEIDLKPGLSAEQLDSRILRDFSAASNRDFSNSLDRLLPKSLIPVAVSLSGIPASEKVNQIDRASRERLCEVIKGLTLNITGTRPIEEAIVTRGGVSVKEISPARLSSRLVSGLYFAGEIIDADALTGGFNLQIAFSTGFAAGKGAAEQLITED